MLAPLLMSQSWLQQSGSVVQGPVVMLVLQAHFPLLPQLPLQQSLPFPTWQVALMPAHWQVPPTQFPEQHWLLVVQVLPAPLGLQQTLPSQWPLQQSVPSVQAVTPAVPQQCPVVQVPPPQQSADWPQTPPCTLQQVPVEG
jgi:hypothetical protein